MGSKVPIEFMEGVLASKDAEITRLWASYKEMFDVIVSVRQEMMDFKQVLADFAGVLEQQLPVFQQGSIHMTDEEEDLRHLRSADLIDEHTFQKEMKELGIEVER
jgi:hypothetical protein